MLIEVKNLTKKFGDTPAVKDVNFTIEKPMMVGVIGRSGAGKSTLLRMMNRLAPATSGQVIVDGVDVLRLKGRAMRRWQRDCAMIFQQFNLVPRLDVLTNVMLGRLNQRSTLASLFSLFAREDIHDGLVALERLGIEEQALKRAEQLSGGQQQRVAIARALMQEPADDPGRRADRLARPDERRDRDEGAARDPRPRPHDGDLQPAHARHRAQLLRPGDRDAEGPHRLRRPGFRDLTTRTWRARSTAPSAEFNEAATSTSRSAGPDGRIGRRLAG